MRNRAYALTIGTIMTTSKTQIPIPIMIRIRMSFHLLLSNSHEVWEEGTYHICLRTRLAPRRNPWADTARLSIYQIASETGWGDTYQSCPVVHLAFHLSRRLLWCSGALPGCQLSPWRWWGADSWLTSTVSSIWAWMFEIYSCEDQEKFKRRSEKCDSRVAWNIVIVEEIWSAPCTREHDLTWTHLLITLALGLAWRSNTGIAARGDIRVIGFVGPIHQLDGINMGSCVYILMLLVLEVRRVKVVSSTEGCEGKDEERWCTAHWNYYFE